MGTNDVVNARSVAIVTWKDIHNEVRLVNKELADIIDAIDPDDSYKLVLAEYLYGDITVKNGIARIPASNGELLPLTSEYIDKTIKQQLSYRNMPLFLILDKSNEIFVDTGTRAIPINFFHKGWISGVYEYMDFITGMPSHYDWHFSAGSRSIFSLPKITDKISLKRLCSEYNLPTSLSVDGLADHWKLFRSIAQSDQFEQAWVNKIVYFGEKWVRKENNSTAWKKFKDYLLKQAWIQAQYSITKVNFALEWEKYAEAITGRRLKPNIYILDQLKHILSTARGDYPAFKPIDDSQEIAPTKELKAALVEIYQLKDYFPSMMYGTSIKSSLLPEAVYYSLSLPTVMEGSPLKRNSSTILLDLRAIKTLIETLERCKNTSVEQIINTAKFDYFHVEKDKFGEISSSQKIINEDSAFLSDEKIFPKRIFCATSSFFRGCVRIQNIPNPK